jgi:hypothetical protein
VVTTQLYVDAPDLQILGGLGSHNLHSYPLTVALKGPVTFLPDGRLQVATTNLTDTALNVTTTITLITAQTGTLNMTVPKGEFHLTLVGEPIK